MANLPNRADIASAPSKATAQAAFTSLYDFVASRFAKGTSGVAAATDAELLAARVSFGLGSVAGRNKIMNGHFQVNQRGYASGSATVAANQFTFDRWFVVVSGQSVSWTASGNGNLVTAPAGGLAQVIEGVNIEAGVYVLNWTGSAAALVNGVARAKGEPFTLSANTNVTVQFSGGTLDLAQLEANGVTAYEHKPINDVMQSCYRYFEICPAVWAGNVTGSTVYQVGVTYKAEKRAIPTIASVSQAGLLNGQFSLRSGGGDKLRALWGGTALTTVVAGGFDDQFSASAELVS